MVSVVLGLMFTSALSNYVKRFVWGFIKTFTNAKMLLDGARYLLYALCYASLYWQSLY